MKQSRKQPAEKRRQQLIRAAAKVFAKKGYSGATTAEIARAARLTKGALYFHFKNKEDLFFAVVMDLNDRQFSRILSHLDEKLEISVVLENMIRSTFEMIDKEQYFSIEFWQQALKVPRVRNFLTEEHRKIQEKIVRHFTRHSNLKKNESEALYIMLHALIDGIMVGCTVCHTPEERVKLVP